METVCIDRTNAEEQRKQITRYAQQMRKIENDPQSNWTPEETQQRLDEARTLYESHLIALASTVFEALDYEYA